ncbi:MAG: hypothetical protein P1R58_11805 [bacterium]|nr:hypothetical protein [bacterium]
MDDAFDLDMSFPQKREDGCFVTRQSSDWQVVYLGGTPKLALGVILAGEAAESGIRDKQVCPGHPAMHLILICHSSECWNPDVL